MNLHPNHCTGLDCHACEREAELRADRDDVEQPDRYGRDADWSWPRGYGGADNSGRFR